MLIPVIQGEAEAPVAPTESSPARAKNPGSRALTPEEVARYQVWNGGGNVTE